MEKLETFPARRGGRGPSRFPDELFDGDPWLIDPAEFEYANSRSLQSVIASANSKRASAVGEQLERLGVQKVETRVVTEGDKELLALRALKAKGNGDGK